MASYYNENDEFAAEWLRNLIKAGLIADGEVDTRSIVDVRPSDLAGFTQCHFFAGIGGWSYALRQAGWADSSPVWTGSCPCQPFSLAGSQRGFADERHLWPVWRELIRECGPAIVFGEQVASATDWLRLVRSDLEAMGRSVGAMPIQAASAGADHLRDRYWFVAYAVDSGRDVADATDHQPQEPQGHDGIHEQRPQVGWRKLEPASVGASGGIDDGAHAPGNGRSKPTGENSRDDSFEWIVGADGKARRVKPGIRLLAHGVPARVGKLRGFGNAIDPRPAAAFIAAAREALALPPAEQGSPT